LQLIPPPLGRIDPSCSLGLGEDGCRAGALGLERLPNARRVPRVELLGCLAPLQPQRAPLVAQGLERQPHADPQIPVISAHGRQGAPEIPDHLIRGIDVRTLARGVLGFGARRVQRRERRGDEIGDVLQVASTIGAGDGEVATVRVGFDAGGVAAQRGEVAPDADGVPALAGRRPLDVSRQEIDQGGEFGPGVGAVQVDPLPMVAVFIGSECEPESGISARLQRRAGLGERHQLGAVFGRVERAVSRRAVAVEGNLPALLRRVRVGDQLPDQPAPRGAHGFGQVMERISGDFSRFAGLFFGLPGRGRVFGRLEQIHGCSAAGRLDAGSGIGCDRVIRPGAGLDQGHEALVRLRRWRLLAFHDARDLCRVNADGLGDASLLPAARQQGIDQLDGGCLAGWLGRLQGEGVGCGLRGEVGTDLGWQTIGIDGVHWRGISRTSASETR